RRRHTRFSRDWSSDVCSSDLNALYIFCSSDILCHPNLYLCWPSTKKGSFKVLPTILRLGSVDPQNLKTIPFTNRTKKSSFSRFRSEERRVGKARRSHGSR